MWRASSFATRQRRSLAAIDVVYVVRRRIAPTYLIDAAIQVAFLGPRTLRGVSTVDEYVGALPPGQREQFQRVQAIVKRLVPEAEATISYGIPTFKYRGTYLIYFAAYKHHMSIYPTAGAIEPTKGTKGTFQFTEKAPVPEDLVVKLVSTRRDEIERSP